LHTVGRLLSLAERANPAVILAGGRGRRLGALADSIPKPMVSVAGRPVLERLVLHLMSFGIRTFYLSVNHLADVIESHFGDGTRFGCRISYLREEIPLGSGGPLSLLDPVPDVPVLVVNGDLVTQCDIGRMIDGHVDGGFVATVSVRSHETQLPFGVARIDGARLLELHEKPVHRVHINAGIYVLSPESLRRVPKGEQFPITDLFAAHLRDGDPVGVYVVEDEWLDIGSPEDLQRARGRDPMMVTESLT
jgi:NDP-sugar pyrophosphorylase family protein